MAGYVYGGDLPHEARGKQKQHNSHTPKQFNPALCGTIAGWNQHARNKQTRCEPCKQARQVYDAAYRARKRERKPTQ